jgi:nucleotide-binding universal stress UspA family protein
MTIPGIGTILCPVDLSEHSHAPLDHAAGLAQTPGSRLVVLRVVARLNSGTDDAVLAARHELDLFVRGALPGPLGYTARHELIVRGGEPAPAIFASARETNADLIVMGTRGRGALARALLGSTAATILRDSDVPVMVVPRSVPEVISAGEDHAIFHFGLVLVPVDLQAVPSRQLAWAARLSGGSTHKLLLVHVVPPGADRQFATERMNHTARGMKTARGVKLLVREGEVVDEVIHVVRHERAGLVIMGRHADASGAMAYEVLRSSRALLLMVP